MNKKLPENFVNKLKEIYTKDELKLIEKWFNKEKRDVTFRVNTLKTTNPRIEEYLEEKWLKIEKIPYLTNWYKLLDWKESDLWNLWFFKEGKMYLQWITSQLIWEIANIKEWSKVLDLTAAPGWKTTHIAAKLNNTWKILAVELNTIRFDKLNFTVKRQWATNVETIREDARKLKETYADWFFDLIIADLPCSSEWRINLNNEKSYSFIDRPGINKKNYKLQKDILEKNVRLLKNWWELIYSTCTLDVSENEWIVHFLLSNFPELELLDLWIESIPNSKEWLKWFGKQVFRKEIIKTLRILPTEETEWFFIAKFKKNKI